MRLTTEPRLLMRGIEKRFGPTVALRGVSIGVEAGSVLGLVGENGAGKSTLMKILLGAYHPDSGEMLLEGAPYRPKTPWEARSAGIAMIHQELSLALHLSVADNIVLGMEPTRFGFLDRGTARARAQESLTKLGHAEIDLDARVGILSPAEQQVVEIARALAIGSRVLVLDEPTSSLTSEDTKRLFAIIRSLRKQGQAIIYISHFLEEVKEISDRFVVLRDGEKTGEGRSTEVSVEHVASLMVGRKVTELYVRSPRSLGEDMLTIKDLTGIRRPDSASVTVRRGEIVGIAGLVGAGRTELLRTAFGLDVLVRGSVKVGIYSGRPSPQRSWSEGMGYVSEDRKGEGLAISLSIADNITLPHLMERGFFGWVSPSLQHQAAEKQIAALRIRCNGSTDRVDSLSGGNQQKVALARLLHSDVDVLLLDEPTRGIDIGSKSEIYRIIDGLAVQGKAILMVSSYLPELIGVCDRIAVMCRGRLLEPHPAESVSEHSLLMEASGAVQ